MGCKDIPELKRPEVVFCEKMGGYVMYFSGEGNIDSDIQGLSIKQKNS